MTAAHLWLAVAIMLSILLALIGAWPFGWVECTAEDRLEPSIVVLAADAPAIITLRHNVTAMRIEPDKAKAAERRAVSRSIARVLAVRAALLDFGQQDKASNPYAPGDPLREIWGHHYERVTGEQLAASNESIDALRIELGQLVVIEGQPA